MKHARLALVPTAAVPLFALIALFGASLCVTGCDKKKPDDGADKKATPAEKNEGEKGDKKGKKKGGDDEPATDEEAPKKPSGKAGAGCKLPADKDLKADWTINKGCEVVIDDSVAVHEGATLTIEKGAKLKFAAGAYLSIVYGKLVAKGTEDEPIVFTSNNKDPAAGDWQGILFEDKVMAGNVFEHVKIEYAGKTGGYAKGAITFYSESNADRVAITNSVIENNEQAAVSNPHPKTRFKFENNVLKKNGKTSLELWANHLGGIGANKLGDPVRIHGDIDTSAKWPVMDVPVIVTEAVTIGGKDEAAILTLPDKLVMKFNADAYLWMGEKNGGGLVAKDVTFTSANATGAEGDWVGLIFGEKAVGTTLDGCIIEYAGHQGGYGKGAVTFYNTSALKLKGVKLKNTTFRKNDKLAIYSNEGCGELAEPASGNKSTGVPLCNKKEE